MALAPGPEHFVCSARDCAQLATWKLAWSNPNLPYGREKIWLACPDHLEYLTDYFTYRKFPLEVTAFEAPSGQ